MMIALKAAKSDVPIVLHCAWVTTLTENPRDVASSCSNPINVSTINRSSAQTAETRAEKAARVDAHFMMKNRNYAELMFRLKGLKRVTSRQSLLTIVVKNVGVRMRSGR